MKCQASIRTLGGEPVQEHYRNYYDEKWYNTASKWNCGGILGGKKYQYGPCASEVHASIIPIINIFKRKKKDFFFNNPLENVYLH